MSTPAATAPPPAAPSSSEPAKEAAVPAAAAAAEASVGAAAASPQAALSPPVPAPAAPKKRLSREELEKQKREEALARKKAQDARFKNRSKRKPDAVDGGAGKKKQKELSAYEQEVAEINKRVGLSDTGAGVRPVTK